MEDLPNKNETKETEERPVLERLKERVDSFRERLASFRESLRDISPETSQKIEDLANKVDRIARVAGMVLAVGVALGQLRSEDGITETKGPDGQTTYEHEDERTNEIMNYMLGRGELPEEDRIFFYREAVREEFNETETEVFNLTPLPENFNELSNEQLRTLLIARLEEENREIHAGDPHSEGLMPPEREADRMLRQAIEAQVEYDPRLAELIWELQQRVGSPRIRFATEGEDSIARHMSTHAGEGRAFYEPFTNTVYLSPRALSRTLIAENAHARQFNDQFVLSSLRHMVDNIRTSLDARRTSRTFNEAQYDQYRQPGTIEHEAHEIIEDELMREVEEHSREIDERSAQG